MVVCFCGCKGDGNAKAKKKKRIRGKKKPNAEGSEKPSEGPTVQTDPPTVPIVQLFPDGMVTLHILNQLILRIVDPMLNSFKLPYKFNNVTLVT